MKLAIFVSASSIARTTSALNLANTGHMGGTYGDGHTTLAQTDAQFIGRIFDLFEMFIAHLLPLDPDQRMKSHGTHFNVVSNDQSASEHGGKMGGDHESKKQTSGGEAAGNFGGSFWS